MKFEATTMLPVHTTAVKRRLLKVRVVIGIWAGGPFLHSQEEDDVIYQIMDLCEYEYAF